MIFNHRKLDKNIRVGSIYGKNQTNIGFAQFLFANI
jgi:hypothetical protein